MNAFHQCPLIDDLEKQRLSWLRTDEEFFSAGACHILAHAFLMKHLNSGYSATVINPTKAARGLHVFVSNGSRAFDWRGSSDVENLVQKHFGKYRQKDPEWSAELVQIRGDTIGPEFCKRFNSRMPCQYFDDPLARAFSFINRLESRSER